MPGPPPKDKLAALTDVAAGTPAKGDLLPHNGTTYTKLAVGADGTVLTADAAQATGTKWAAPSGGASPAGATGTLQYNAGGGTLGDVTGSSVSGGGISLAAQSAGETPLTLVPHAGQTAPLLSMPNSRFDGSGDLRVQSGQTFQILDSSGLPVFQVSDLDILFPRALVTANRVYSDYYQNYSGDTPTSLFNVSSKPVLIGDSALAVGDPTGNAVILAQPVHCRSSLGLANLNAAPSAPSAGDTYFDVSVGNPWSNKQRVFNGTIWEP